MRQDGCSVVLICAFLSLYIWSVGECQGCVNEREGAWRLSIYTALIQFGVILKAETNNDTTRSRMKRPDRIELLHFYRASARAASITAQKMRDREILLRAAKSDSAAFTWRRLGTCFKTEPVQRR